MEFSTCANDETFGPSVQGCRGDFDFTLKFEKVILSILPSAIFIALSIPRAIILIRKPRIVGGASLQFIKLTAIAIYVALQLALVVLSSIGSARLTSFSVASSVLSFASAICIGITSFLEHSRSPRPSMLLNAFLLLTILFDIAQIRSTWLSAYSYNEVTYARVFLAATAWKGVLIVLESQHKQRWLQWDLKRHSPEETSGLYGLGTFFWLNSLFLSGYKKILTMSDLFALDKTMSADFLQVSLFSKFEQSAFHGQKNGLARTLASSLAIPLLLPVIPRIALIGLGFCQPFLLQNLLDYLAESKSDSSSNKGYGLIGATILIYTSLPLVTAFYWYYQERALFMVRACLSAAIYKKTTKAKASISNDSAALTLMSTDIERIRMGFMEVHEFWASFIQVAVSCWLLQQQLGAAFAAPIVVVALCIIVSTILMQVVAPRQRAWMEKIQTRVGHTANVISNMKHLKISGLAHPVEEAIQQLRVDELQAGSKFRVILVWSVGVGFTPVLLAPVFTFAVTSRTLDITTAYTSISYLLLLTEPMIMLFQVIPQLLAAFACLQRVQKFLETESRHDFRQGEESTSSEKESSSVRSSPAIKITEGSFSWSQETLSLRNINCSIPRGLTIVVGPVASGKSTLCKALLGETPIARGKVIMDTNFRRVGYCDQVPFLFNASIRDNIIGLSAINEQRYEGVIEATMLTQDLLLLPQGDRTKIGSDGIILSGGQKQRVSIARALYLQCDLLIFDDILSGLDADTERHVFNRVFGPTGMLKKRGATAVLCTHSIRHLPSADHIIALAVDGTLVEEGTFNDLVANEQYVHSLGIQYSTDLRRLGASTPPSTETPLRPTRVPAPLTVTHADLNDAKRIMGDKAVFKHYFGSIGPFWLVNFFLFGVVFGFFHSFPTIWLKYWSEDATSPNPKRSTSFYVGLYALFQCLALVTLIVEAAIALVVIIRISGASLHKAAVRTVIAAPLRFFATTDTGVVTNLFSQDITLIDGDLPEALINTSVQIWIGLGVSAVVATSSPYITITYPFVIGILYSIQKFYLRTSRQLRLLDLEAKSPLYTNFLDTMKGVATFRAFGWTDNAISFNNELLDTSQRPAYLLSMVQRWLYFVLSIVVAVIILLVVTLSTQLRSNTGFTGASMVSLMSFGRMLANLIQSYTSLETSIGAVARLKSFSENTVPEDLLGEDVVPPTSWPESGKIEIKGVSASYRDPQPSSASEPKGPDSLALQDLELNIEPGQKVAICGRTGSGKSSTILLLLRLLDPLASCSRNMFIDGLPLHTIDRSTLRQRIIAVPQDAVFFPDGTSFKINLDPYAVTTDEECEAVLEIVDLWAFVSGRGGLAAGMAADTLSQGQKQLFSLARAILRRRVRVRQLVAEAGQTRLIPASLAKNEESPGAESVVGGGGVLILDEISSSVDIETDKAMQGIIRREFRDYTIVMVSHRLEMVMEFDKVLVMETGKVVEEGVPIELLEKEGSRFRDLWMVGRRE